jgi:hypothetical protein
MERKRGSETKQAASSHPQPDVPKEPAMMFAFAVALFGIAVLRSLEYAAARS